MLRLPVSRRLPGALSAPPHAAALVLTGVLLCVLIGCGQDLSHLETVDHPELASVEESARRQLEEGKKRLKQDMKSRDESVVAAAFGHMGRLYHAYSLWEPAETCYRNGATLEPRSFIWPYLSALLALDRGDSNGAEPALRNALELRPDSPPAHARLGELLLLQGRASEAREHFEALADKPDFAALRLSGLGRVAAAEGEHEQAVDLLNRALALQPGAGGLRNALAQSLRGLGRQDEAQAQLARKESGAVTFPDVWRDRLEALPKSSGSFLRRGNKALLAGDTGGAVELFKQGKEANSDNLELRLNLALALVRAQQVDDAMIEIREVLKRDPQNAQAHHDLGTAYRAKNLTEDAIASFEKAVELEPEYASAHFNLANAYGTLNQWAKSEAAARRVLKLEPDHSRARYLAAMAQFQQGRGPKAEKELRGLIESEPEQRIYREGLVSILTAGRRFGEALTVLRAGAREMSSKDEAVGLLNNGAAILWRGRRTQDAISLWRLATELDPESSEALTQLANGLQLLNQQEEAARLFGRAVELDPQNSTAWLSCANLLILAGRHQEAKAQLEQALELHPKHMGLTNGLARLLATSFEQDIRDGERALFLARRAYAAEATLEHAETVAMAMAERGRFEDAIRFQTGLVRQAQTSNNRPALRRLIQHLKMFENRRAIRAQAPRN